MKPIIAVALALALCACDPPPDAEATRPAGSLTVAQTKPVDVARTPPPPRELSKAEGVQLQATIAAAAARSTHATH
jgi:hypothetical protein